ncbi:MAG: hypothetical protein ACYDBY_14085 [Thermoanaerobaculia bacterium]
MKYTKLAFLFPVGLLAVATACGPSAGTVEKKSESTTETSQGSVTTSAESTQIGTTLEAKSETTIDTPSGNVSSTTETVIGTVTQFTAGKNLEVMTGDKTTHDFDLGNKDIVFTFEGDVAVGKRVTVVRQTGDDKIERVTVKLEP